MRQALRVTALDVPIICALPGRTRPPDIAVSEHAATPRWYARRAAVECQDATEGKQHTKLIPFLKETPGVAPGVSDPYSIYNGLSSVSVTARDRLTPGAA